MTRKAKIGWAVGAITLATAASSFFSGAEENKIRVNFLKVANDDSNSVIFVITNTSDKELEFACAGGPSPTNRVFARFQSRSQNRRVPGHQIRYSILPANAFQGRWSVSVRYNEPGVASWIVRTRNDLARKAAGKSWNRLSGLLKPSPQYQYAEGPPMFGNKPLAEAQK